MRFGNFQWRFSSFRKFPLCIIESFHASQSTHQRIFPKVNLTSKMRSLAACLQRRYQQIAHNAPNSALTPRENHNRNSLSKIESQHMRSSWKSNQNLSHVAWHFRLCRWNKKIKKFLSVEREEKLSEHFSRR